MNMKQDDFQKEGITLAPKILPDPKALCHKCKKALDSKSIESPKSVKEQNEQLEDKFIKSGRRDELKRNKLLDLSPMSRASSIP